MASIEQSYYENAAFWRPDHFLAEDRERLDFIVDHIPMGAMTLLDVGCGNGLFLKRVGEKRPELAIHGVERSKAALEWVEAPKTEASIDALPFSDRSFDVVTCLEVIEHLPVDIFVKGLTELARVAQRTMLISVPADQDLTLGRVECQSCRSLFNPDFHWRSFDKLKMHALMLEHGFFPRSVDSYGPGVEYAGASLITRLKKSTSNRFPQDIPCPSCGANLPGRGEAANMQVATSAASGGGGVKGAIKALWPKVTKPRWILGWYERAGA